jgi:hypothetical protein
MTTTPPPSPPTLGSPSRPRTPTNDPEELKRRLARAEREIVEQKDLFNKAASDYGKHKENEVFLAVGRRATLKRVTQAFACVVLVLLATCVSRGATIGRLRERGERLERALITCKSDVGALESVVGVLRSGGMRGDGASNDADADVDVKSMKISDCREMYAAERTERRRLQTELASRTATTRSSDAFAEDAVKLRRLLDDVKQALAAKDQSLQKAASQLRILRAVLTLIAVCVGALASQPAVRESFRGLLASADRRQIEANAREEARRASNENSPARSPEKKPATTLTVETTAAAGMSGKDTDETPAGLKSPTRFSRTKSSTEL